eukprot:gb/GEZN01005695.1/.p1 GENE.gb/GEZN01005695.1/~~gb/GEZN01005695.1/.p1  ORF type:complete len:493 (-),score=77.37 gb/GEZN01005695.1/:206-1684(-)
MLPRHKKRKANTSSSSSASTSSPALSLDDNDVNAYTQAPSLSSPVSHDLAAVQLCSSLLSIQEQLKSLSPGRYAEERPGAPVFEVKRDAGRGSIEVTRYIDICHDLQAITDETRQRVVDEIAKRTQDLLDLDKEIAALEDGEGEDDERLVVQIGQLHVMKRQHKKRIRELQKISEIEVKVQVDRACLRVEVVQEETARVVTETRLVPMKNPSIYVMGGGEEWTKPSSTTEWFNTKTQCWEAGIPMTLKRFGCMSVVAGGYLYAIGGYDGKTVVASVERFDRRSQSWEAVAPMPTPRDYAGVATLGGKVYVVGGTSGSNDYLSSMVCFDPATNKWEDVVPMKQKRAFCVAVVLDSLLYVVGGMYRTGGGQVACDVVERFDPAKKKWELMSSTTCTRNGCAAAVLNGQIYVIGGVGTSSAERFDSTSGNWKLVAPMACARNLCAVVVIDGWLYAIGGVGKDTLSTVERYDYKTNSWEFVAPMRSARFGHGAAIV